MSVTQHTRIKGFQSALAEGEKYELELGMWLAQRGWSSHKPTGWGGSGGKVPKIIIGAQYGKSAYLITAPDLDFSMPGQPSRYIQVKGKSSTYIDSKTKQPHVLLDQKDMHELNAANKVKPAFLVVRFTGAEAINAYGEWVVIAADDLAEDKIKLPMRPDKFKRNANGQPAGVFWIPVDLFQPLDEYLESLLPQPNEKDLA